MLNKILIQGRLTRDPEVRHTQSGTAVTGFTLAVERDFKDRESGEKKADFINVTAWRQTGEFASKYFSKGRMAIVEGSLQMREYIDKSGAKRNAAEVIASNIYFGDSKQDRGQSSPPEPAAYSLNESAGQFAEIPGDSELPF
ncbi:MAG: single-stranded DNA-binding protein [Evtepia sp.]